MPILLCTHAQRGLTSAHCPKADTKLSECTKGAYGAAASVLFKRVLLVLCVYWVLRRRSVFRAHFRQGDNPRVDAGIRTGLSVTTLAKIRPLLA